MAGGEVIPELQFVPDKRHSLHLAEFERTDDRLDFELRVRVHRFEGHTAATAGVDAVRSWAAAMERLQDTLEGEAVLEADNVTIRLVGDGRGHVECSGKIQSLAFPSWGDASLSFTMPGIDQTFLPAAIAGIEAALALPPHVEDE